jgi:hypothetical protein
MEQSILLSTKKILGIAPDYTVFDLDILTHINSAFSTLTQLGVGPVTGFMIEDESTEWEEFFGSVPDNEFNSVKTYVYLRVRQVFDPPTTSFAIQAFNDQIRELEWRLNVHREETQWVDPDPDPIVEDPGPIVDAA